MYMYIRSSTTYIAQPRTVTHRGIRAEKKQRVSNSVAKKNSQRPKKWECFQLNQDSPPKPNQFAYPYP